MRFVDSAHAAAVTMSELMSDAVGDGLWFWFVVAFSIDGVSYLLFREDARHAAHTRVRFTVTYLAWLAKYR